MERATSFLGLSSLALSPRMWQNWQFTPSPRANCCMMPPCNCSGHRDHGASHQLLGIVVAGIVPTNVAELAIHSEPSRELLHDATLQLFGRQYLQIFRWTASAALPFL